MNIPGANLSLRFPDLIKMLHSSARQRPEELLYTFLTDGDEEKQDITFGGLDKQARAIAVQLQGMDLAGQRAVLLYPPGLDYIAGFFGCLYAGVVAVPAYPPDPNRLERTLPRLQAIIQDCQAQAVLTTEAIGSMAQFFSGKAPDLAKLHWVATDTIEGDLADRWQEPGISGETLAFLQYTSGSTGNPKGVMLSHSNLINNLAVVQNGFEVSKEDRGIIWLPPYHDMGLIGGILGGLYSGISVTLLSPLHFLQKPFRWLKTISRFRGTISGGPNFAYEMCVRKITPEQKREIDLSAWSLAFTGAESILSGTLERFAEAFAPCGFRPEAFYPCYGLAEGTLMVTGGKRGKESRLKNIRKEKFRQHEILDSMSSEAETISLVGCGTAFPGHSLKIVRPDTFTPCREGEVGEIWAQGPSVAQGYWDKSEESKNTLQAQLQGGGEGPFLRTGDLGFQEGEELFVTGRLKDLIIIRGQNHYPQDIERSVEACHQAFRPGCGAAFSIKKGLEEVVVLFQEVDDKRFPFSEQEFEEISQSIHEAVAKRHDLKPHAIVYIKKGTLPKTSSGKVRRFACREEYLSGEAEVLWQWVRGDRSREGLNAPEERNIDELLPKTENIMPWLVQRLSEHLGVSPQEVDLQLPLAGYGLDSKEAVALSGDLAKWLGCQLSPVILWKYPTLKDLAQYLSSDEVVRRASEN